MSKSSAGRAGILLSAVLTLSWTGASAQLIEEVVVTAQKREQSAQDLPISINAFTGDQLSELGVTAARELADYTAGVQINMEYGNAPTFTVRGINVNDFGAGTSPAAAVYVDGIYKASNINSGPQLFDLERVEILKGPQGTLWGKNTTGGAINVVTRKPTSETEGFFQVGFGNFGRIEMEGAVGGALSDNLSARLSVQSVQNEGVYETVTFPGQPTPGTEPIDGTADARTQFIGTVDPEPGDLDTLAVRTQFLWDFDNVDVLAILHYARDRGNNPPTTSLFTDPEPFDNKTSAEFLPQRNSVFSGASVQVDWDISDSSKLVSITGYDYFDRNEGLDTIGPDSIAPQSAFTQIYLQEFDQFSQELRFEVERDRFFWLVGAYYADSTLNQNDDDHYSIGYFGAQFNYRFQHDNTTVGLFAHSEWQVTDTLNLTLGLRYDDEEREQPFYKLWFLGGPDTPVGEADALVLADNQAPLGDVPVPDQTYSFDGVSYRIGLDWRPVDSAMLYLSHSKGLKSGGFRSDAFTTNGNLVAFLDEELLAYEVGVKWDPTDTLRLNLAAFYYDYERPQGRKPEEIPGFGVLSTLTNFDSADVTGVEAELVWAAAESFELGANLSFLDTEISDATDATIDGNQLAFAPESAYTAFGRYLFGFSGDLMGSVQVNVGYTGDHFQTPLNDDFEKQNYTLVGASAMLFNDVRGWQLSIFGQNLTDEIYSTNFFGNGGVFISQPRTYGVRLKYGF